MASAQREQPIRLSDEAWKQIEPLLPPPARTGRPRAGDRRTVEAILYVLRTGCRWQDLPRHYGAPVTAWRRLRRWEEEGVLERIWRVVLAGLDEASRLDWKSAYLDGSFAPAKKGSRSRPDPAWQGNKMDARRGWPWDPDRLPCGERTDLRGEAGDSRAGRKPRCSRTLAVERIAVLGYRASEGEPGCSTIWRPGATVWGRTTQEGKEESSVMSLRNR